MRFTSTPSCTVAQQGIAVPGVDKRTHVSSILFSSPRPNWATRVQEEAEGREAAGMAGERRRAAEHQPEGRLLCVQGQGKTALKRRI